VKLEDGTEEGHKIFDTAVRQGDNGAARGGAGK